MLIRSGYPGPMRSHIVLDDELVTELDARAGRGGAQPIHR